ncbi:MAG: TA0938 family protein [Vulcanisaeta sp.]|mgnify:CR=1 FL=1|jgi:hypothetical protein|uniref:Uncharacterized protein n=1 Tax=Vulcanisaeta moutnovskia (strain 768-28) TaxID=985053 RepID=F0QW41_VULM7|nr:TA0938 family protein [Vulcanisaeta moutnovskia]ADY00965.1 hypothetical protein VMUT_0754 [Vulcanisaeta moutnovskia 768-28]
MIVLINGRIVGDEYTGCALCGDNRRTGTYLSIDGTLRCKMCGKPWIGFYQEVAGIKLYFCCGDHYKEFRKIIERIITISGKSRIKVISISINGGERTIRIESENSKEISINEPMFNLTKT